MVEIENGQQSNEENWDETEMSVDNKCVPSRGDRIQSELEEAERERGRFRDLLQRVQADFINYRRRVEDEQQHIHLLANSQLISSLLPVMDDFDRASNTIPSSNSKKETAWLEGLSLVIKKFHSVLEEAGVEPIKVDNQQLDPWIHEVVAYEETKEHSEGKILNVIRQGYRLRGKVLRPALVTVAKLPESLDSEIPESKLNPDSLIEEKEA